MLWKKLLGAGGLVGGGAAPTGITFVNEVSGVIQQQTTTTDVTLPASLAEGDVLVFMVAADFDLIDSTPNGPVDFNVSPDGWFHLHASEYASTDGYIYGLVCGSSPPTTVRVRGSGNASNDAPYVCQAWRGVDARLFDARSAAAYTTGTSANPDPPSVTTVTDGALVIAFAMMDDDDTTVSVWPTGYTNQIEKGTGNGGTNNQATIAMCSKIVTTAGSENPSAYTFNSSDQWSACSIALQPDQTEISTWSITEVGRKHYTSADGPTYNLPTVLENDYVLIFSAGSNFYGSTGDPMNSSGWTVLDSYNGYRWLWAKKMGATPDTTFNISAGTRGQALEVVAFRGVDTSTPQDVALGYTSSSSVHPSITTATNNALLIRWRYTFGDRDYSISEWPIGYGGLGQSARQYQGSNLGNVSVSLCYTQQDSAGATGTLTTRNNNTGGSESSGTMALRTA
jgi:hypothetical protein